MKKNIQQVLKEKAIPWDEIKKEMMEDFTPEQTRMIGMEIKKYDMLVTLRTLRKNLGLTQAELAAKAQIPRTTISKIESGSYNPTVQTLAAIAESLGRKLEVRFV